MELILNINERYRPSISEWSSHPAERLYSNINHVIPNLSLDLDNATKIIFDKSNQAEFIYLNHHLAHSYNSFYCS